MEKSQYVRVVVNCHSIVEEPNLQAPVQCPFCLSTIMGPEPVTLVTPVTCGVCKEDFHVVFLDAIVVSAVAAAVDTVVSRMVLEPPSRQYIDAWDTLHGDQPAIIT